MYKLGSTIPFSSLSNYQRFKNGLEFLLRSFSSMKNFVEPTAVAYRAALMQGIPLEELPMRVNFRAKPYKPVTLEESIQYLSSPEYQELYRGKPVWFYFRRNYKGHFPPKYPRKSCTRAHKLITSNPCPICRDEYLVIDHKNVGLLKQFLHPLSADILEPKVTGLCGVQHKSLLLAIEMARDMGTIQMRLPFRLFDYSEYYGDVMRPEELRQLASHVVKSSGSGGQLEPLDDIYRKAARSLANLPASITSLLHQSAVIPHIEEVAAEPPTAEIERPKIPNRYQMEETYRKLLLRRKRAKSILLYD
ncbi:28S ribosomal protein S18b mitochondrial [Echinococcus multilocularis]|uniref:Small ribosomal subunit protein mS40 n=1 Tax=Echinococcus multilocularis TaxID=6211 RepID=A0A068Y7I0_ECHMU|nr:28S ribosomal protein S18b mitochondrial [Echinococcus multilocularis]